MPRILYVDDEADIREVATMSLELDPEIEVRACGSGQEALDAVEHWKPDLVLLDVMMPVMDGPETLARLRRADLRSVAGGAVPIVFITARSQDSEVERLKSLGAAGVIAKPFDPMQLAEQVRSFLT